MGFKKRKKQQLTQEQLQRQMTILKWVGAVCLVGGFLMPASLKIYSWLNRRPPAMPVRSAQTTRNYSNNQAQQNSGSVANRTNNVYNPGLQSSSNSTNTAHSDQSNQNRNNSAGILPTTPAVPIDQPTSRTSQDSSLESGLEYAFSRPWTDKPIEVPEAKSVITLRVLWPRANYLVNNDIEISSNGLLKIEAGSTLSFAPGKGISALGPVRAVGNPKNKITFRSQLKGCWRGITLEGPGTDGSLFEFCIVRDSNGKPSAVLTAPGYDADIPDEIKALRERTLKRQFSGIFVKNSRATFRYCQIEHNSAEFQGAGMDLVSYNGIIDGCLFQYNKTKAHYGGAISIEGASIDAQILNCSFFYNEARYRGGAIACGISQPTKTLIKGNTFRGNKSQYRDSKNIFSAYNCESPTIQDNKEED